jgi:hypothetical protein
MKLENETYEIVYNDIMNKFDKEGCCKRIKEEIVNQIGYSEIINEEKN